MYRTHTYSCGPCGASGFPPVFVVPLFFMLTFFPFCAVFGIMFRIGLTMMAVKCLGRLFAHEFKAHHGVSPATCGDRRRHCHRGYAGRHCGGRAPKNSTEASPASESEAPTYSTMNPRYEINVSAEAFVVEMEVPGIVRENLDVSVENDGALLVLTGERSNAKFSKKFRLDQATTKANDVSATLENGILTVTVPKEPLPEPEKVNIPIAIAQPAPTASAPTHSEASVPTITVETVTENQDEEVVFDEETEETPDAVLL